ncbi:aldose 1-epimerase family protein [Streptomyces pathocidini]|uniref:aldose 1-epimerase family protein n=1 Tax=Streptomyces pathocidini TaxID=1650571 RepID=UPI0033C3DC1D
MSTAGTGTAGTDAAGTDGTDGVGGDGRIRDPRRLARYAGDLAAVGGVRAVVLDDGAERGVRALEFRTGGGLRFEVLVDRAMDIGVAEFDDHTVGWRSPTGFRHPALHETDAEDGLSWLRSMSGLLVTAGLDHTLFGGEVDAGHYAYPPKAAVRHGLHGRIANTPARLAGYGERWDGDRCVLWAEGEVRQATVFGEHLRLTRRVEADLYGTEIRLTDTVVNAGFERTPHMFLYHVNVGWPLLDEGSRFEADIARTLWQTDSVKEQGASHLELPGPRRGFVEQVYEHELTPGADGRVRARVANDRLGRFFELDVDPAEFPAFFEWLNAREGAYAIGLEPSTHHVAGDTAAREDGSMIWLEHGEARNYHSVFRFGRLPGGKA